MTQLAARDWDRRVVAKRIYDALSAHYPDKYIALIQPVTSKMLHRLRRTQQRTKLRVGSYRMARVPLWVHLDQQMLGRRIAVVGAR